MNRKIISEYLKTLVFAVVATLVIGTVLCFLLFASGKSLDTSMPQYLILNINQYLSQSETGFSLEKEGMEQLDVHDLWLQIVDEDGTVVYDYQTGSDIPDTYTNFELVNITLTSDRLPGYTPPLILSRIHIENTAPPSCPPVKPHTRASNAG